MQLASAQMALRRPGAEWQAPVTRHIVSVGAARFQQDANGQWGEWRELDGENWWVPSPASHTATAPELLARAGREVKHYGLWIEVAGESVLDPEVRRWCQRYCNSELGNGAFRFAPAVWNAANLDQLSLPYVAEYDHPDEMLRAAAAAETRRRLLAAGLDTASRSRDVAIRAASDLGYSRRELARLVGVSFGRIQQIVRSR